MMEELDKKFIQFLTKQVRIITFIKSIIKIY